MAPRITFCSRCRGMRAGWNKRYVSHWLFCKHWLRKSFELTALAGVLTGSLLVASPEPPVYLKRCTRTDRAGADL
jgi:hypothetical protein